VSTLADYTNKKCLPCEGIGKAMNKEEVVEALKGISPWEMIDDGKSIARSYVLKNFVQCVDMINLIKDIAESENHHPDIHLTGYKNLRIVLNTHALGGVTENDFILAAKINKLGQ
jgi:4a-hydroxytetrahydrobiopterin dehydratase